MEIEFSQHALDQLKVRNNITKDMVIDTLKRSDKILESYRGRELYQKLYNQEILEVVIVKEDNKLIVVTQYFLEQ